MKNNLHNPRGALLIFCFLGSMVFLSTQLQAQEKKSGCVKGNCQDGSGTYIWQKGYHYSGDWKDGQMHGQGTSFDQSGKVILQGIWHEGLYKGSPLEGDCRNGAGQLSLPDGGVYEGTFKDCQMWGKGKLTFPNGDIYEGLFINGTLNGEGTYFFAALAEKYTGQFKNGIFEGHGRYMYKDGSIFEGEFHAGGRQGSGTFQWPDGENYRGSWQNDQPEGNGIYRFQNGDEYAGHFQNSFKSQKGTYKFSSGQSIVANWQYDKIDYVIANKLAKQKTIADGEDTQIYPGESTEIVIGENRIPHETAEAVFTKRQGFLIYRSQGSIFDSSIQEVIMGSGKKLEIEFTYYVVWGNEGLTGAAAMAHLEEVTKLSLSEDFEIEAIRNLENQLRQVIKDRRLEFQETRIFTIGGTHYYFEEDKLAVSD